MGFLGSHLTWVLFPGVACTLNEACGHQQDELWTRGFCWWCPVMPKKSSTGFGSFPHVCAECFRKLVLCPPLEGGAVAICTHGRRPAFYLMTFLPEKQNHTKTYISQMKVNACCTLSYECFLCSGGIIDHLFPFSFSLNGSAFRFLVAPNSTHGDFPGFKLPSPNRKRVAPELKLV